MFDWLRRLFGPSFPRIPGDGYPWMYSRLRHTCLKSSRAELKLPDPPPDSPAWGVLMECGFPGGVSAFAAFSDGATNSFRCGSDIVIYGKSYEQVRQANAKFIEITNDLLEFLAPGERCPVARLGETIFYARTDAGILYQRAALQDLHEDGHVLSPLYHAGNEIFSFLNQLETVERERSLRECIARLDEAISRKPTKAALYFDRAELYGRLEEFDKALADHDKAVALMPGAITFLARGCLYTHIGDFNSALADFENAIKADPRDGMAYSNRGATYSKLGDIERAIADYGLAIKYEPKYPNSYANRAYAYYKIGEYEKGIADCDRAISLRPDHAETYSNRGLCRAALGDKDGARADFIFALELAGSYSVVEEAVNGLRSLEHKPE